MELDIYNFNKRQVRCVCNKKCFGTIDDPKLEIGKIYTLVGIEIHSWYTEVYLDEAEGIFNSCSFEEIEIEDE